MRSPQGTVSIGTGEIASNVSNPAVFKITSESLYKILGLIVKNPDDAKFRSLAIESETFQRDVAGCKPAQIGMRYKAMI